MSVIVKGMKMPKNCETCEYQTKDACFALGVNKGTITIRRMDKERPDWCPLAEYNEKPRNGKGRYISGYEGEWIDISSYEGEIWKPVKGYEDNYMISNFGRVRSRSKILSAFSKSTRYPHVVLSNGDSTKRKNFSVHRLVAEAFVENPNPEKYKIINHKDENKNNNRADNLEWCDYSYNSNYGTYPKRNAIKRKELFSNRDNNWKCKGIRCVETGKTWRSAKDVEDECGIDASSINKCCKGERKTAGGFKWEYITA